MSDRDSHVEETVFLDNLTLVESGNSPAAVQPASDSQAVKARTDHRLSRRRRVRRKVGVTVRIGTLGLGADVGRELFDVTEDGLGITLKEPVTVGREVTLEISLPGVSKPLRLVADVRWCMPAGNGSYRAGVRLRRRLPYTALTDLTR
jgi:hypothetical protein